MLWEFSAFVTCVYLVSYSVFPQQGIISDLFPGVVLPTPDYDLLIKALTENIKKMNLQPVPWFLGKIIQVYFHVLTSGEEKCESRNTLHSLCHG